MPFAYTHITLRVTGVDEKSSGEVVIDTKVTPATFQTIEAPQAPKYAVAAKGRLEGVSLDELVDEIRRLPEKPDTGEYDDYTMHIRVDSNPPIIRVVPAESLAELRGAMRSHRQLCEIMKQTMHMPKMYWFRVLNTSTGPRAVVKANPDWLKPPGG